LRNRHDETTVLHALQSDQAACELFDLSGFPVDNEDFETRIMVKMRMTGRDHQLVVGVLEFGELLSDAMGMMVINEGDGAHYGRLWPCRLLDD
jgi:hypothetical protein